MLFYYQDLSHYHIYSITASFLVYYIYCTMVILLDYNLNRVKTKDHLNYCTCPYLSTIHSLSVVVIVWVNFETKR